MVSNVETNFIYQTKNLKKAVAREARLCAPSEKSCLETNSEVTVI